MPTGTTGQTGSAQNYDTPVGVGGQINTNTGAITSGTLAGQQAGTSANNYAPTPPVSQTQNASAIQQHLSGNTTGTVFPPAPTAPTGGTSANTSIPAPIPSAQDIINQGNQQTPGEATNQTLLQKVAALIGSNKTQTTLTNESEAAAGIPGLNKTLNDLNTQLEGLTNQATDLANQAAPGGAIQNQEQQNAQGRGITAAGLAPLTAGDLRENQIKQSAIASQSLTLKSAIYGVNGQITLAKDAADKAATAQYEVEQQQIDYMNALIKANEPQMSKEEKNQALLVQNNLQDRQNKIQQAQDDKKTIVGLAVAAMTNNPNNPQAQYAAQQALAESNKAQPDLQAALGLVGQYQRDPNAVALQVAQLQNERLNNQKLQNELSLSGSDTALQPYLKTSYDGTQYVDLSTLTPAEKVKYAQMANAQGVKAVMTPADADKISHIAVVKSNLQDVINAFNAVPVEKDIAPAQGISNSVKNFFGDANVRSYQNFRTTALNTIQGLAGGQGSGLRITQAEIVAAQKDLPILTGVGADTPKSAAAKLDNLNKQLDKWQTQILGGGNTAANDAANTTIRVKINSTGQTGTISAGDYDAATMTKI